MLGLQNHQHEHHHATSAASLTLANAFNSSAGTPRKTHNIGGFSLALADVLISEVEDQQGKLSIEAN